MTTATTPNANVQAVLNDLEEWTGNEPELEHQSGDRMTVTIDTSLLWSGETEDLIIWLVDCGWKFDVLCLEEGIITATGEPYPVP